MPICFCLNSLRGSKKFVTIFCHIVNFRFCPLFSGSQTKFVAIVLVLSVFFLCDFSLDRIFRLTLLTFRPKKQDKQGSAQRALSALRAFQFCFSPNCFGDLTVDKLLTLPTTAPTPPLLPPTPPHRAVAPTPLLPPPYQPPIVPPPPVATFEQPIAKNTQFYTHFENFCPLRSVSPRCQGTSSGVL